MSVGSGGGIEGIVGMSGGFERVFVANQLSNADAITS
jgi:hypothetical protein